MGKHIEKNSKKGNISFHLLFFKNGGFFRMMINPYYEKIGETHKPTYKE